MTLGVIPPRMMAAMVASMGRRGDTRLAHVTPAELRHLRKRGGAGTRNPLTGLPEFYGDSDSQGTAGGGGGEGGDNGVGGNGSGSGGEGVGGFGDHGSLGGGNYSESSIGGPGGDGSSQADHSDNFGNYGGADRGGGYFGGALSGFQPENNPEMGGGRARQRGQASVDALGDYGRDVNAASSVMAGRDVSFGNRAADAFGIGAPGGFAKSGAAAVGLGLGLSLVNPALGFVGYNAYNSAVRGAPVGRSIGQAIGGVVGGPLGALAGRQLGNAYDSQSKATGAATGTDTGGYQAGSAAGSQRGDGNDQPLTIGRQPEAGPQSVAPSVPTPPRITPESWDETGFLARNPEVKAAVDNGTWPSGFAFDAAYKASAGVPYEAAMTLSQPHRYDDILSARPGQIVPYRG